MRRGFVIVIVVLFASSCAHAGARTSQDRFEAILQGVADAWNAGDAAAAANLFAEDAVYLEPPDRQLYRGRRALYEFFGGDQKIPMSMTWHHLAFDETAQIGFGEYTFKGTNQYHGIVVVRIRDGKIANWREYQYKSAEPWSVFTTENPF